MTPPPRLQVVLTVSAAVSAAPRGATYRYAWHVPAVVLSYTPVFSSYNFGGDWELRR